MMKLVVFLLLAGIAAASVLPIVSHQRAVIVHQPYHHHHYAPHYGYGYGHGYGHGHGHGYGHGYGHGHGHGVSARYFHQASYPEYGIYRPVGIHYGGHYHNGYGRFGYGGLGYYY